LHHFFVEDALILYYYANNYLMNMRKLPRLTEWIKVPFFSLILLLIIGGCDYILPNKPPYVKIIQPSDSSLFTIGQVVNFQVNAYDVDGSVVHVVFSGPRSVEYIDDTAPYEFDWQTAGLLSGTYEIQIMAVDNKDEPYIIKAPVRLLGNLTAFAGKDTIYADSRTSSVLQAVLPPYSQGTWTIVSGTGGQISDIHNANATLTGLPCQSYILRWTVTNGTNQVADEVTIGFFYQPSPANAGADQVLVDGSTSVTLQATVPKDGSGLWRIASGGVGSFSNLSLANATFTGQPCATYKLVWTVSTPCVSSADTVEIRFDPFLIQPNAGPDQIYRDGSRTTAILAGNAPPAGTGTWTVVAGQNGSFSSVNDPKAVFTGQLCQTYILRWTIATPCSSKSDEVTIIFDQIATIANAGTDINLTGPILSVSLGANIALLGVGTWTVVSGSGGVFGDIHNPATSFTGLPCQVYVLKWTIASACESSSDQVNVSFTDLPTVSNAGPDLHLTDGSIYARMNANHPSNGKGIWSIVSGGGGSFTDPNDPNTSFYGTICHSYVLRWTVSTACSSSFDEVTVVFNQVQMSADAGPDIRVAGNALSVALNGNAPALGLSGTWTVFSGTGGAFENVNDPKTLFTGVAGQIYTLKWTLSGACLENSDLVIVAFVTSLELNDPRDGKTYRAVKIGSQTWMSENLNYSVSESFAYNDSSDPASIYGRLYTWSTANSVCPTGWHLPTDAEWRQLELYLGMDQNTSLEEWYRGANEGGMLKEEGTAYWEAPNAGATNITGFSARPGGYRTPGGVYGGIKTHGGFWTATGNTSGSAIYRGMHKDKTQVGRDWYDKAYGFSIRCVKN
jgi:uncharacterized protein (TIGR02145 family)